MESHRREIDGLRACAVLAVVMCHAVQMSGPYRGGTPWASFGARGVDLFFVVSGFCLSWPLVGAQPFARPSIVTFLRRRLTRIVPVCWVALALFASLAFTPFGMPASDLAHVSIHDQAIELFRDAIFFPTLSPLHDPPMWSLGVEMRWYILFIPLLLLFYRSRVAFVSITIACYVAYAHVGVPDLASLPSFMLGIVAAAFAKSQTKFNAIWPSAAIAALGFGTYEQLLGLSTDHGDPVWALACFAIVTAVTTNSILRRAFAWPPLAAVGVASYSIYLVHDPILKALIDMRCLCGLAGVVSVAFGFAFWFAVERPLVSSRARRAMDDWIVGIGPAILGRASIALAAASCVQGDAEVALPTRSRA